MVPKIGQLFLTGATQSAMQSQRRESWLRRHIAMAALVLLLSLSSLAPAAPTISQIIPFRGQPGDVVTIRGSGFDTDPASNDVRFGPNRAAVRSASPTELSVQIPPGQPVSFTNVTVSDPTGATSNSWSFLLYSGSKIVLWGHFHVPCDECGCDEKASSWEASSCESGWLGATLGAMSGSVYADRGELYQRITDYSLLGRPEAHAELHYAFRRHYRSRIELDGPLGHNWDHQYFERLETQIDGSVVHYDGLGRSDRYRKNNLGELVAPPELFTRLTEASDGSFTLRYADGLVKRFDATGRLLDYRDRNDNLMTFHYDALGRLERVNDSLGRDIDYAYDAAGRLAQIRDYVGRTVELGYDANGDLTSVTSPAVTGTPNGNDFPAGKTTRYSYSSGFSDNRLNHNLLSITRPNEVAAAGPPALINVYGTNQGSIDFDRITSQTFGGTNASGVAAGGTYSFTYEALNPGVRSADPNLPVSRVTVVDRNGNTEVWEYNRLAYPVLLREFTKGLRPGEPRSYDTSWSYNADGLLLEITYPESNRVIHSYDTGNAERFAQGNRLSTLRLPDAARGGDQTRILSLMTYEPIYQRLATWTDPRGTDTDFTPPVPEPLGRLPAERYSGRNFFDYQEAPPGPILPLLAAELDVTEAEVQSRLAAAGIALGQGDLNDDGLTPVRIAGNVVRAAQPPAVLLPGSNQASIEGDELQDIVTLSRFNDFGQSISRVDPEGNVDTYAYFPENDPDGDGDSSPGTRPGLSTTDGGYLAETLRDTESDPSRNNGTDPEPVRIGDAYAYDPVGNKTRATDGRGIETTYFVNQLDQVVRTTRAAAVPAQGSGNPPEPLALTAFAYIEDSRYDFNDNLTQTSIEDRGDTSNTSGFVDIDHVYDILDNRVEMHEEVDVTETLRTLYRYDANENPALTLQPLGNAFTTSYDERDLHFEHTRGALNPTAQTLSPPTPPYDPRGGEPSTTTYHYDANRNLVELVDAEDTDGSAGNGSAIGGAGDVTRYTYDGFDRQIAITDAVGNATALFYDPADNRIRETRLGPIGGASPTDNGGAGNVLLAETEYLYDELDRQFREDRSLFVAPGVVLQRGPDVADGPHTPGDDKVSIRNEYDRNSRLTFRVEDDLDSYRTDYDGVGRRLLDLDPEDNSREYAYDDNDNLIEIRETDVAQTGDPDEIFLTTYFYDSLDRLQQQVDNLGQSHAYRYDSRDNQVAMADAQGPVTGAAISRRAFADGPLTVNAINDFGNVSVYEYDGINRKLREDRVLTASGEGDGVHIGADLFGVKTDLPPPDPTQSADGLITVHHDWDQNSLLASLTDDHGNQTQYFYDNLNREVAETKGVVVAPALANRQDAPTTIDLEYDRDDNLVLRDDENGSITRCDYDAINRRIGCSVQRAGSEVPRKDPSADFPPVIGTTTTAFEYDGLSRTTRATDNNDPADAADDSRITVAYDSLDRVIEETQKIGALDAKAISSAWFAENQRVGVTYPDDRELELTYDGLDRLDSVSDAGVTDPIVDYAYIGSYRVARRAYPINGTVMTQQFDGLRRVIALEHRRSDSSLILGFGHDYDRMNNKGYEEKLHNPGDGGPGNSELYGYDSVYRLVDFGRGTLSAGKDAIAAPTITSDTSTGEGAIQFQDWVLDGLGNWSEQSITKLGATELEGRLDTNFNEYFEIDLDPGNPPLPVERDHDDNGNLLNDGRLGYRWDYSNRLVQICRLDPSDTDGADDILGTEDDCAAPAAQVIAQYVYDAKNRRIRKDVQNAGSLDGVTDFYYADWQVLEERGVPGPPDEAVRQFVYGVYIDEPLVMDQVAAGAPEPTRFFYHQNTLSSTFGLTTVASGATSDGDLVEGYQYDAYGTPTVIDPGANGEIDGGGDDFIKIAESSAVRNPYSFTGRRLDVETGIHYYRGRKYDAQSGRFLGRDPADDILTRLSLYEYVHSNPISMLDPFGDEACKDIECQKLGFGKYQGKGKCPKKLKKHTVLPRGSSTLDIAVLYGLDFASACLSASEHAEREANDYCDENAGEGCICCVRKRVFTILCQDVARGTKGKDKQQHKRVIQCWVLSRGRCERPKPAIVEPPTKKPNKSRKRFQQWPGLTLPPWGTTTV